MDNRPPPTVLICDDDLQLLNALSDFFEARGFVVVAASSPVLALAAVQRVKPDACLLDYEMPAMHGFELAEQFRRHDCAAPVFILTGDPQRAGQHPLGSVTAVVPKNVGAERIVELVQQAIGRPPRRAAAPPA